MSVTRAKLAATGEAYQRVVRSPTPLSSLAAPRDVLTPLGYDAGAMAFQPCGGGANLPRSSSANIALCRSSS